jgi:hypothetical protein
MMRKHRFTLLVCSLAFSACALPYRGIAVPNEFGGSQGWQQSGRYRPETPRTDPTAAQDDAAASQAEERMLYGWDGGVVDARPQGRVVEQERTRGLESSATGRLHIIELYQQVLDERDALTKEVAKLNAALAKTEQSLVGERGGTGTLQSEIESLKLEQERLLTQNQELAARLTHAQIRRLEAEKLLLQSRIEEHRAAPKETDPGGNE